MYGKIALTFSISDKQHGVIDHPGVAQDPQRVRHSLSVKLHIQVGNSNDIDSELCTFVQRYKAKT